MSDGTDASIETLTDREREGLRLLLAGHTAKSAANELDLSVHTINDYLREARRKLGVSSSREAARILGEQDSEAPQNRTPAEIGMGAATQHDDHAKPSATPGTRSYRPWIIGGLAMSTAAITAALALTTLAPSDTPPDTGAASKVVPAEEIVRGENQMEADLRETALALDAARSFARHIDAGDYTASWAEAGSMFKQAVTADAWAAQAAPIREPLGVMVSRTEKSIESQTELPGAPRGEYRLISFDTDFSNASGRSETFVMAKEYGRWGVVGYFIR